MVLNKNVYKEDGPIQAYHDECWPLGFDQGTPIGGYWWPDAMAHDYRCVRCDPCTKPQKEATK